MPHRNQTSELEPIAGPDANGSDQQHATAGDDPLADVLHEVVIDLFSAGLQAHLALQRTDRDTEPARRMHSVIELLDRAITTLRHASSAPSVLPPALTDPPLIAQAEGILAERHHIPITDAVITLAAYARQHEQRLPDVARAVIDGTVDVSESVASDR